MNLKPLKFIGHKIGPFEHIELTWDQDSRYTLIVGENGMGKTTLVAAMAACLSLGGYPPFSKGFIQRFAHDKESFAYFEIKFENEIGWLLRWGAQVPKGLFGLESLKTIVDHYYVHSLDNEETRKLSVENDSTVRPTGLPPLEGPIVFLESGNKTWEACSENLISLIKEWKSEKEIKTLAAAYGINRDIQHVDIDEYRDFDIDEYQDFNNNPLRKTLNPFVPPSTDIFQWIAKQFVNNALAISEGKPTEAEAYLTAIRRVEHLLSEDLETPISFHLKRNPFRLEIHQNGVPLPFDQLSDGTRSLLSWPLDYLMRASRVNWADPADSAVAPGLILVDEIDMHLHPEWQRRIIPAVSRLLPETYLIATTHSPFVLGAADDAQVFQIYENETGQLEVRSSFDELYGYPADLVLEKTFVPSLYAPEVEQKLQRLSNLAAKVVAGDVTGPEKAEHDRLLRELAQKNPWLNSFLALSQTSETAT